MVVWPTPFCRLYCISCNFWFLWFGPKDHEDGHDGRNKVNLLSFMGQKSMTAKPTIKIKKAIPGTCVLGNVTLRTAGCASIFHVICHTRIHVLKMACKVDCSCHQITLWTYQVITCTSVHGHDLQIKNNWPAAGWDSQGYRKWNRLWIVDVEVDRWCHRYPYFEVSTVRMSLCKSDYSTNWPFG